MMCNVKGIACNGGPTEDYHPTLQVPSAQQNIIAFIMFTVLDIQPLALLFWFTLTIDIV